LYTVQSNSKALPHTKYKPVMTENIGVFIPCEYYSPETEKRFA